MASGLIDPPTILGVPLIPFISASCLAFELGALGFFLGGVAVVVPVAILYFYGLTWAREVCASDVQRLRQTMLRAQIRWGQGLGRQRWGAVTFGPTSTRGAR